MLPRELLDARRSRGRITLNFASEEHLPLAKAVLTAFRSSVGRSYSEVQEKLSHMETARNYRKVRGFAKVIERMCRFEQGAGFSPIELRRFLFSRGYVVDDAERDAVIAEAARRFGVTPGEVERLMFSDLPGEEILREVPEVDPWEIVRRYNLSLLQTLTFSALRLTFEVSSNHQRIFRLVKWLGLMYELTEDGRRVEITGPASILKLTRKYGTSMARLIPEIVRADDWWIMEEILDSNRRRVYTFELRRGEAELPEVEERVEYDSKLERQFAAKVRHILNAEVIREPGILKAGNRAYIPDFLVRKNGKEVYVEIAGFWTEEYLRSKLEKLSALNVPLLVVASDELLAGRLKRVNDNVVLMRRGKIPYKEVVLKLKRLLS
ncbi:MAG: DUF790 family protein [Thermococci archaeon]|nr:DUF790 family protein [Thermococci archaeon]